MQVHNLLKRYIQAGSLSVKIVLGATGYALADMLWRLNYIPLLLAIPFILLMINVPLDYIGVLLVIFMLGACRASREKKDYDYFLNHSLHFAIFVGIVWLLFKAIMNVKVYFEPNIGWLRILIETASLISIGSETDLFGPMTLLCMSPWFLFSSLLLFDAQFTKYTARYFSNNLWVLITRNYIAVVAGWALVLSMNFIIGKLETISWLLAMTTMILVIAVWTAFISTLYIRSMHDNAAIIYEG